MIIKIITCHDVYNVGASLQAYALSKYLAEKKHNVEIIDYKPDYLSNNYGLSGVNNPKYDKPVLRWIYQILKFPSRFFARNGKRKKRFDDFRRNYLPLTSIQYSSFQELRSNPPKADIFIAGSDQIWNTIFRNGKDPAFYLKFVSGPAIRASYAASFATEKIETSVEKEVASWISDLDYISVRESSGLKILQDLGVNRGTVVVDPVFLLSVDAWYSLCSDSYEKDPYIFVYDFDCNNDIERAAKFIAKEKNYKIFTLQKLGYGDKCFPNTGPLQFISLIRGASFVISNSFHATAFSIIFEKEFLAINRKMSINSRMKDMLLSVGLGDRMKDVTVENTVVQEIDYQIVKERLSSQIRHSEDFLSLVLSIKEVDYHD